MSTDSYINNLKYEPNNVMVNTSAVPSYQPEDGELDAKGHFRVIKKKECTVQNSSSDLTYIDSLAARLIPGTMLLCNSKLIENNPSIVPAQTKPVKFGIDLPGFNGAFTVDPLTKSSMDTAVGAKISEWKKANPNGNIAAKVKYSLHEVKSRHKLEAELGFKLSAANQTFNVDFKAVESGSSREWILKFDQIYYNVTLDSFGKPSDIIADSVGEDAIKQYGVNDKNPIGIINNVSYGRIVYVRVKTTNMTFDLSANMDLILNKNGVNIDSKSKNKMEYVKDNTSTDVFVYGGGTSAFSTVPNIGIDTVNEFIAQGYNFDASQIAAPIGYSVVFMKNGGQDLAVVNSTSTYIETTVEEYDAANLKIEQKGAFVNRFNITWNEITYNNGTRKVTPKGWERNGKDSCAGQTYNIFLKGNTRNLYINSKGFTGIVWDKTRTNFDGAVELRPNMKLTVSGTTLKQKAQLT